MAFELPDLPYSRDALAPTISEETLNFHYGKHHKGYVDKLNKGVEGTEYEGMELEEIIRKAEGGIFNNAAQVWNHTFYWHSMSPNGGGKPNGKLGELIDRDFGGYDGFVTAFKDKGGSQFGSGWAWLVQKADGTLDVTNTLNAHTPVEDQDVTPLMTMDVWEHAYYLDYQNARPSYMNGFLENLVNWDFAESNLN
ncbi:Fe-Mn family superoxide dismutase [uncultured Algimonas sp.]|uniref:superoxide dismutase n=1 Tax=uncultured Algimonas sp. TaxID=1547920 RepID=UPI0026152C78|nr:Fe-Mn family superoxide dismutase [uncultured Algimonas sp.]